MRYTIYILCLIFSTLGCGKDEKSDLIAKPDPFDGNPASKIADSVYNSLEDIAEDLSKYHSVKHLLESENWRTVYQRSVSVVQPDDTVFIKERPEGRNWKFMFGISGGSANSGYLEISWDGNLLGMGFSFSANQLVLNQAEDHEIYAPTIYKDGSISFSLKHVQPIDSIHRVEIIKLQSFR